MNWEAIGAIGELMGAVAVVLTLGYLAIQIRQNTEQVRQNTLTARAAAVNASTISLRENRKAVSSDPELSELFRNALEAPAVLSDADLFRFRLVVQNVTDALWDIYNQAFVTDFSPETWQNQGVSLARRILGSPGGRWFWENFRSEYPQEFQAEIDGILETTVDRELTLRSTSDGASSDA
jgi:hypothetical protein